jgi:hypothetical protein
MPVKRRKVKHRSAKHKKQILCPYCGAQALLREGSFLFEDVYVNHLYVCVRYPECDSYVAAHDISKKPMGSLANGALRKKRLHAHLYFDRLWKVANPVFTRNQAYRWLDDKFGGSVRQIHIGGMGEGMCNLVIKEVKRVLKVHKKRNSAPMGANVQSPE